MSKARTVTKGTIGLGAALTSGRVVGHVLKNFRPEAGRVETVAFVVGGYFIGAMIGAAARKSAETMVDELFDMGTQPEAEEDPTE